MNIFHIFSRNNRLVKDCLLLIRKQVEQVLLSNYSRDDAYYWKVLKSESQ